MATNDNAEARRRINGTGCVCKPGQRCLYHARAPRACPQCKTGTITRMTHHDVVAHATYTTAKGEVRHYATRLPSWCCNRCEYCEVES